MTIATQSQGGEKQSGAAYMLSFVAGLVPFVPVWAVNAAWDRCAVVQLSDV